MTDRAIAVLEAFRTRGWRLATAESCTGGLIAAALTAVPGSSEIVECGYVTYSNAAKATMLGVDPAVIETNGAVSEPVALAMARGALTQSGTNAAVSVTGVAGPGGGSPGKPVGTVWFGLAVMGQPVRTECKLFQGDRAAVRLATLNHALELLVDAAAR